MAMKAVHGITKKPITSMAKPAQFLFAAEISIVVLFTKCALNVCRVLLAPSQASKSPLQPFANPATCCVTATHAGLRLSRRGIVDGRTGYACGTWPSPHFVGRFSV